MPVKLALLFFVKFPEPGKVKTRLAAQVGPERAAEIYRQLAEHIAGKIHGLAQVIVQFDPPEKRAEVERWLRPFLPEAHFVPQCRGDLGARLSDAFAKAFGEGHERVAVIGSDCVEIDERILATAFSELATHDCVLGPSEDGGYYLLALKSHAPRMFDGIAWSSERTFAETLQRARALDFSIALLPRLRDVDTESDWQIARRFLESASPL